MKDKPVFTPQIPHHLVKDMSDKDQWIYEQLSVQRQQNEWIIDRLQAGESRFESLEAHQEDVNTRVNGIEKFKTTVTAKWAVVAALVSPLALAFVGAAIHRWFEKAWK